jgi:valyl-tRNA synthetase
MELDSRYSPHEIEDKWYSYWESRKYFKSEPDNRKPYSIVIPPPNITGVLHMGHMLNNTVQDILIRRARLLGMNACWVPGTDHASIATEAKVVHMLREKGIKKSDLSREDFLKHAFEWKEKYGGIILQQLRKLGASCDWDRTAFTMDQVRSEAVIKVFVDLYRKGKLYRGNRMINWDPEAKTVLSTEEVLYKEESAQLFHIKYVQEDNPENYIIIATQRPETIMADSAVAVHPDDERYSSFHGKKVIIPLIQRAVPVITDEYVDRDFGTGALKITPAHDQNDYELGIKHQLEIINILNEDGSLNDNAKILIGEDRFTARKKIRKLLEDQNVLIKVQDYKTNIGRSERTNAVVEPRLSLQWYVDMKALAAPALKAVKDNEVEFLPDHMRNTYNHWMENIKDWCISRQLWWGHQIPAYYYLDEIIVAETLEEAVHLARIQFNNPSIQASDLKQDEDVLDTWFSSWLWPISVFDGFNNQKEIDYYYPTAVLVTGWDIIFLWVARMIMAGYEWRNEKPFEKVYFTGMVRDKQRRKMSKSLGNSPDALKLIEEYGADGVRFGMLACAPAGGDLLFDEKLCEQGRNFANKIWNALRLVKGWHSSGGILNQSGEELAISWMESRFQEVLKETHQQMEDFRLSESLKNIYSFVWEDFCGFYLEAVKPKNGHDVSHYCYEKTLSFFEQICILLHPYMPFITEEIWHLLRVREKGKDCINAKYPLQTDFDMDLLQSITETRSVITQIRELRNKHQLKMNLALPLAVLKSDIKGIYQMEGASELLIKLANVSEFVEVDSGMEHGQSFMGMRHKYFLDLPVHQNIGEEVEKLTKEIEYSKGFIQSIQKKLENERFVESAPKELVEKERKKLEDGLTRLGALEESLAQMHRKQ